jgi:Flp pilus assembly protein TadG
MSRRRSGFIANDTRATTTLEAAVVLPVLTLMLLGAMELGLVMWTNGTLRSVAALTARCVSISAAACTTPKTPQQYAVGLAQSWLGIALIAATDVTVTPNSTTCNADTGGSFTTVQITSTPWAGAIYPLRLQTQTITACFPT